MSYHKQINIAETKDLCSITCQTHYSSSSHKFIHKYIKFCAESLTLQAEVQARSDTLQTD